MISGAASRIAKPLRGGGGADGSASAPMVIGVPSIPILSSLQSQDNASPSGGGGKRSSWFFQNR